MTRDHAAVQLLRHGPLLRSEFVAITGWPESSCVKVIGRLRDAGVVKLLRAAGMAMWALAEHQGAQ